MANLGCFSTPRTVGTVARFLPGPVPGQLEHAQQAYSALDDTWELGELTPEEGAERAAGMGGASREPWAELNPKGPTSSQNRWGRLGRPKVTGASVVEI